MAVEVHVPQARSVPAAAATRRSSRRHWAFAIELALVTGGVAAIVLGAFALIAMPVRWIVALGGVASVVNGFDRVGKRALGPRFEAATVLSVAWLAGLVLAAVGADLLPLESPDTLPLDSAALTRPDLFSAHPLGTDNFGRDYLARLIYGARVSLGVGIGTAVIGLCVGSAIGVCAGYFRGKSEAVVNVLTDFMLAFPPLVFLLALVAILRPGLSAVFIGLSVLTVPTFIRLAKANTIRIAGREYVLAAMAMGATRRRIVARELLPNMLTPSVAYATVIVPGLIVAEAALSFLGMSVKAPQPTWGNMIAEAQSFYPEHPHTVVVPGVAMFLTVFALNRLGQRARQRREGGR